MEKDKKYSVMLGIMIFLFLIVIAIGIGVGLGVIEFNFLNINKDNVLDEKIDTSNDDVIQENTENEKITADQKKALIVPYIVGKKDTKVCAWGDCQLELKVDLPKINLDTQTVKNINSKLEDVYVQANEQFKKEEAMPISYDITYVADYLEKLDCIYISVDNHMQNTHGSGSMKATNIIYMVEEDKEISLKEFLSSKNITEDKIKEEIKITGDNVLEDDYSNILIKEINDNTIFLQVCVGIDTIDVSFNY